jgi:hypothetical protein
MEFTQLKLSKSEWNSTEIPVSDNEMDILKLIISGYHNVNIKINKSNSIFTFLKIEYSEQIENYLYDKYLAPTINNLSTKYNAPYLKTNISTKIAIKTADKIRISKTDVNKLISEQIYEFSIIEHIEKILKCKEKKNNKWIFHYFTLYKLSKNNVLLVNKHISNIVERIIKEFEDDIDLSQIIENSSEYIEHNHYLLHHADMNLYDHQKQIFTISKDPNPKLVLYIAPTGTGKTLSPIGLSEQHKIIFVCAARHVGLALARAAISINKKIAFAFGCSCAENIRLHYFSAKEYTRNTKTGGIYKVDNSVGDNVEIMICDIRSYIPAMLYMLSFNNKHNIITYWDEPTISMDYQEHELHEIIKRNWNENLIPNVVLSSATLPKLHELTDTISDFKTKFQNATIYNIVSHDCRKSIPLVNNSGFVEMPHYMSDDYDKIQEIANHCENYLTILRYFDLKETSKFIAYVESTSFIPNNLRIQRNFGSIDDIDMKSIKLHYLKILKGVIKGTWGSIYMHLKTTRTKRIMPNDKIDPKGNKIRKTQSIGPGVTSSNNMQGKQLSRLSSEQVLTVERPPSPPSINESGNCAIYVTTKDAYTLTDGPTIFIVNDVDKISKFCIQQAGIPSFVMSDIMEKIEFNNNVNEKMDEIEKVIENITEKSTESQTSQTKEKKVSSINNETGEFNNSKLKDLTGKLDALRSMIKSVSLNDTFVPNKPLHIKKWTDDSDIKNAFTSNIDEDTVISIMLLKDVEDNWKVLLLLGIGVFTSHKNPAYTEIMKKLADEQKLYMIIATSDYIYGTNYQFCHGYLSKDLLLTQEKIIQALGRIGRNNIQQEYSIRFRDDEQIRKLFTTELNKPEVVNMNRLFNSSV